MNRTRLISLAALLVLPFAPGCYVYHDNGGGGGVYTPAGGDVTFLWTLDGYSCSGDYDVDQIVITIPGESLDNGGYFDCRSASGVDGITLHNFAGGTYDYTIDAIDNRGRTLYSAEGSFTVNGSVEVDVDLR